MTTRKYPSYVSKLSSSTTSPFVFNSMKFYYVLRTGTNYWSLPINVEAFVVCVVDKFEEFNKFPFNPTLADTRTNIRKWYLIMAQWILALVCKYIAWQSHQLMSSVKFIQLEFNWSPLLSKMVIFDDFYPPIAETCGAFVSAIMLFFQLAPFRVR